MPNHIHLIWRLKALNGKEMPHASFLKFKPHSFIKKLEKTNNPARLYVDEANKKYEFWKRDSLAVHLFSKKLAFQIWIASTTIICMKDGTFAPGRRIIIIHQPAFMKKE